MLLIPGTVITTTSTSTAVMLIVTAMVFSKTEGQLTMSLAVFLGFGLKHDTFTELQQSLLVLFETVHLK